jgi:hypothetical protein
MFTCTPRRAMSSFFSKTETEDPYLGYDFGASGAEVVRFRLLQYNHDAYRVAYVGACSGSPISSVYDNRSFFCPLPSPFPVPNSAELQYSDDNNEWSVYLCLCPSLSEPPSLSLFLSLAPAIAFCSDLYYCVKNGYPGRLLSTVP